MFAGGDACEASCTPPSLCTLPACERSAIEIRGTPGVIGPRGRRSASDNRPIDSGNNVITIEFKRFGVALDFTPTVLGDGLINLKIAPEVSELDPTGGVTINGAVIPGIVVRRASTSVELRDGQSFAVAGLLQNKNVRNTSQVPWLGSVPVLGTLFKSAEFAKNETDLVIIVTPRLVRPATTGEHLTAPTDLVKASNDAEFFLGGRQEKATRDTRRARRVARAQVKPHGHILNLELGEDR